MTGFFQDLRYSLRQLRKSPAFASTAILILAVGVGGTTAIFSTLNPILFEPLPYPHANEIVTIWSALLLFVSIIGCALSAWRAARIDPMVALRYE